MIGVILASLILTGYMFWCGRLLIAAKHKTKPLDKAYSAIKVILLSFSLVAMIGIIMDLYYFGGNKGHVYKKTTITTTSTNAAGPNDPYNDKSSSGQTEDGSLEVTILKPDEIKTRFSDVAGQEEAKAEVIEIVDFLKNPDKYTKLGANLPKGVLLYGPPGTGKTLMARAVSGESNVTFIVVDGAGFDEMYVGVGAARVRELFKIARDNQPCIVFIDEIDALAPPRAESGSSASGRMQTINQLLAEMDNVLDDKNKGIIVMAATNRLDAIDTALLRPGRFDRKVYIRLPNYVERSAIFKLYLDKVPTSEIDSKSLAGITYGFSGADIRNLVNEAALYAARNNQEKVGPQDFSYAIDKIKLGLKIESAIVTEEERRLTAYHEAGHTIVGILSPNYDFKLNKVTIGVRDATLGVTHFEGLDDNFSVSRAFLEDNIALLMGGRIAEEMLVGKRHVTTGASNDLLRATQIAQSMVTEWGVSDLGEYISFSALKAPPADNINNEVDRILKAGYERAKDILSKNKSKLDKLAKALMVKETLDRQEVLDILGLKTEVTIPPKPGLR